MPALQQSDRILPGGYLYMSDLLGQPSLMNEAGKIIATAFADRDIDVVMTVETKGIPLAYATAAQLNLPVVLVRRDHQVTEGSAVSINYVSGSHKSIHTMSLSRRALKERSRVLIVDDFMKAGGTIQGMVDLLGEFNAEVAGVGVLVESGAVETEERLLEDYISLAILSDVDSKTKRITVNPGNYFENRVAIFVDIIAFSFELARSLSKISHSKNSCFRTFCIRKRRISGLLCGIIHQVSDGKGGEHICKLRMSDSAVLTLRGE